MRPDVRHIGIIDARPAPVRRKKRLSFTILDSFRKVRLTPPSGTNKFFLQARQRSGKAVPIPPVLSDRVTLRSRFFAPGRPPHRHH